MFSFIKNKKKDSYIDNSAREKNRGERFVEFFENLHNKPDEEVKLEIRIVHDDGHTQEVEICYGNKKRRKKLTKLLPNEINLDPLSPGIRVQALNLNSLSNPRQDFFLFKKRLLEAMSKINNIFLDKNSSINEDQKYTKLWDSTAKKTESCADDSNDRANLTTLQKALLLAVINNNLDENDKLKRTVISQKYNEIEDKTSFKKFIFAATNLLKNKDLLIAQIFPHNNFSSEARQLVGNQIEGIINEQDLASRDSKIKLLRNFVDQASMNERTRWQ